MQNTKLSLSDLEHELEVIPGPIAIEPTPVNPLLQFYYCTNMADAKWDGGVHYQENGIVLYQQIP